MSVVSREEEYNILKDYITDFIKSGIGKSIYVSGVPGSGKTYTVTKLLKNIKQKNVFEYLYINCGHLKTKNSIYLNILRNTSCMKLNQKQGFLKTLQTHFLSCKKHHIMVLDEIDLLITPKQELLYNIFDLPYIESKNMSSKLLIIVIANTLNLPEKLFEAKVNSRLGTDRIYFKPYTHEKINKIIESKIILDKKIKSLDSKRKFEKNSIDLLSKRISAVSGDIRKVEHILDQINSETNQDIVKKSTKRLKSIKAKSELITIFDVDNTMKSMYNLLYYKYLENLNLYSKILLFCFQDSDILSKNILFEKFDLKFKILNLDRISYFEFLNLIDFLISIGILEEYCSKLRLKLLYPEIEIFYMNDKEFKKIKTNKI
ncbi:subunit 1 of origin recognition complex [Hamiltosporidium tvaerminnensis]|uniref:Origin recognition complex subunit 1 n=1 Tax=Hamiltosporidium tvaerminnensis TaxID=1176355 RepID=A0A4Q9M2C8_9MICR|nr:subunit 1 of origin recognition complex [Hamiltosporidium tvaerminnensis]